MVRHLERDLSLGATSVFDHVVEAFLENQEYLAAQVGAEPWVEFGIRRAKLKLDVARGERVGRETPHPVDQIAQMISLRIYGPDNVAHRTDHFVRSIGDHPERLRNLRRVAYSLAHHFTEQVNLRQARTNVVMQICGDAPAYLLERFEPFFAASLQSLLSFTFSLDALAPKTRDYRKRDGNKH